MPNECRPPVGTPEGAICVLFWHVHPDIVATFEWTMEGWGRNRIWHGARVLGENGWRFHSLATPRRKRENKRVQNEMRMPI